MPDPRLRTILESQLADIETNANAWNLPTSEFDMPELQDPVEPASTPNSPYECHSPSPLTHALTDGLWMPANKAFASGPSPSDCGPHCPSPLQGAGCKHYPPEHSLHHWRRWSVPHVKREIVVQLAEVTPSPDEHAGPIPAANTYLPLTENPSTAAFNNNNNNLPLDMAADETDTSDTTIEAAAAREARLRTAWAQAMILSGPDDCDQLYAGAWERREKWLPLL
ncbi:hypothetical protein MMC11_001228 [Xylographa trunciseda]|nr:hypothetical protein [Xylographa trunciseda]